MDTQYDPDVAFYEEQRLGKHWLQAVAIVWLVLLTAGLVVAVVGLPGRNPNPDITRVAVPVLAVVIVLEALTCWLVVVARMITEVRPDGITVSARPFKKLRRTIPFDQIASCEARTYSPIGEYGGWGIRIGRGGKAYNMSGNRGVQLVLTSGERVLIGSQKADELAAEIQARIGH